MPPSYATTGSLSMRTTYRSCRSSSSWAGVTVVRSSAVVGGVVVVTLVAPTCAVAGNAAPTIATEAASVAAIVLRDM